MSIHIRQIEYAGFTAVEMESSKIKVTVIPELGAKLVSIYYKPTNKEWLASSASGLQKLVYGSSFTDADMSGWDECFPTIDACPYPLEGKYKGVMLPDHGEVWSLPWKAKIQEGRLHCEVRGQALPYLLKRTLSFTNESELCLDYEVENLGCETLSVMWTAHPQFVTTPHTSIRLPEAVTTVLCVYGGETLQAGNMYDWPYTDAGGGQRLDQIGSAERRDGRKFYIQEQLNPAWSELYERDSGEYLRLAWRTEEIPYLGIWIDEGRYHSQSVCALEPSTGFYDSLESASRRRQTQLIQSGECERWRLTCRLGRKAIP